MATSGSWPGCWARGSFRESWSWVASPPCSTPVKTATLSRTRARPHEDPSEVWIRTVKVFAFVAALVLLGTGLTPLVDRFVLRLPAALLFWVNMISAILDNATLAAAEISVAMSRDQVTAALLGLLVSGGMLIPGNIPNIVAAGHLKITSRAWAKIGVPVGLIMMGLYFAVWLAMRS